MHEPTGTAAAPCSPVCARIAGVLGAASAVTIVCHVRPDADTVGSALALAIALDRSGTDVEVAVPGGYPVPRAVAALPGAKLIAESSHVVGHDVVVAVDCASLERLDAHGPLMTGAGRSIVIDHHASNCGFGDIDLIDPEADCTAELILAVLDAWRVDVDIDIATCLYAGLVTDTGSFRWARPSSHAVAARLLATGVDGPGWTRRLLDTHGFAWLAMAASALRDAALVPDAFGGAGLVYAVVDHAAAAAVEWDETESVIDLVRTVGDADVAVVFKESAHGRWAVSMRSRSGTDLVPLARRHGGGGHPHAAGFSIDGPLDDVIQTFLAAV